LNKIHSTAEESQNSKRLFHSLMQHGMIEWGIRLEERIGASLERCIECGKVSDGNRAEVKAPVSTRTARNVSDLKASKSQLLRCDAAAGDVGAGF
jgi:hypothetical protein